MKKDISIAVMATILVLQVIGGIFGGVVEDVTDKIAETLSTRVQVEQILSDGY
jgi:ATP-dependent protease ClpP protease subunit